MSKSSNNENEIRRGRAQLETPSELLNNKYAKLNLYDNNANDMLSRPPQKEVSYSG